MITLTELCHYKGDTTFERVPNDVNLAYVMRMYPNRAVLSAPTIAASLVFDGKPIPKEYYKELTSVDCTTLVFVDGSTIDVEESMSVIRKLLSDDKRGTEELLG